MTLAGSDALGFQVSEAESGGGESEHAARVSAEWNFFTTWPAFVRGPFTLRRTLLLCFSIVFDTRTYHHTLRPIFHPKHNVSLHLVRSTQPMNQKIRRWDVKSS